MKHDTDERTDAFCAGEIRGVSYAGRPQAHTAVFISKKVEHLVRFLEDTEGCLVFVQNGVAVPDELRKKHCFRFSDNPQFAYAQFAEKLAREREQAERVLKYRFCEPGYYVSESAHIGKNAYIESGCVIGHHVTIGDNASILTGAVIKNAVIGDDFLAGEYAAIGTNGFMMADNEDGNKVRVPTLGAVRIGDHVEIGPHCNVSRGIAGETVIGDWTKIDALTYVGHDVRVEKNTVISAGCVIGGFTVIGEASFLGFNASVRNRLEIGSGTTVGMGAVVVRSVGEGSVVVGNPAGPGHPDRQR